MDLDINIVMADLESWFNDKTMKIVTWFQNFPNWIQTDVPNWFQALPQNMNVWAEKFVAWLQALPDRAQNFVNTFPDRFQAWLEKVQRYFQDLHDVEYIGWGVEATGLVLVLAGIILW
ncbi:hypothetical protein JW711_04625 [Candidatus Woesearchaeota archaeon]|nr:hypothetical protein [Candidatus Woesearchaeota archaeon]